MINYLKNWIISLTPPNLIKIFVIIYIAYVLITGVFIFLIPNPVSKDYIKNSSVANYYSDEVGPDRCIVLDKPLDSGLARLKIIYSAKKSLDISYFSIESGESPNIFLGSLLEVADRGVEVNLILDGMFHGLRGNSRAVIYTLGSHPNINLKFYEPINLLKPWTLNNRMHDKYIIADNKIAIIGGRNIGDKYFAPEWYSGRVTNDRDIIVINTEPKNPSSVLNQLSDYFHFIWNHKYSISKGEKISKFQYNLGLRKGNYLRESTKIARQENKNLAEQEIDLMSLSLPTNKISFIHNPIERFCKEPWVWYEITQLMKSAKDSIFAQSPYVVPNSQMIRGFLSKDDFEHIDISILTNSLASTPNFPAYAGYLNHRKRIIDIGVKIYEYQSLDSIHAKAFTIDDNILIVGSYNIDPRSTYLSTESMIVIHGNNAVSKFKEGVSHYMDESLLVSEDYDYVDNGEVREGNVSVVKRSIIILLSYLVKIFEHLL